MLRWLHIQTTIYNNNKCYSILCLIFSQASDPKHNWSRFFLLNDLTLKITILLLLRSTTIEFFIFKFLWNCGFDVKSKWCWYRQSSIVNKINYNPDAVVVIAKNIPYTRNEEYLITENKKKCHSNWHRQWAENIKKINDRIIEIIIYCLCERCEYESVISINRQAFTYTFFCRFFFLDNKIINHLSSLNETDNNCANLVRMEAVSVAGLCLFKNESINNPMLIHGAHSFPTISASKVIWMNLPDFIRSTLISSRMLSQFVCQRCDGLWNAFINEEHIYSALFSFLFQMLRCWCELELCAFAFIKFILIIIIGHFIL